MTPTAAPQPVRRELTTLSAGEVLIEFATDRPAIVAARCGGAELLCAGDHQPRFEIARIGEETLWSGTNHPEITVSCQFAIVGRQAVYAVAIRWEDAPAVDLEVRFVVEGDELRVGFRRVVEHPGFQLLGLRLPPVARVATGQAGARLALPLNGGRLIDPARCPDIATHAWPGWNWQLVAGCVHHAGLGAVVEMESIDDVLGIEVAGKEPRAAALAPIFAHRAPSPHADLRFVLHDESWCRMSFLVPEHGQEVRWLDGAKRLRRRFDCRPPVEHRGILLYGVYCDIPPWPQERRLTFAQLLDDIRRIERLTDGIRQNPKLIGWQHRGHDTGYPDMSVVNPALGGEDGLRRLIAEAPRHGATIACHDNLQSAYKHSPAWDPAMVMRDQNGDLHRGGVWAGGQLYLIHYDSYWASGALQRRIAATYDRFPFAGTCYFDEMSVWLQKRDYRRDRPASGDACFAAMKRLIALMRERGILLMSEGFTGPLAGHLAHGWLLQDGVYDRMPHGERIPFVHAVFAGRATYGGDVPPDLDPQPALALFNGRTTSTHLGAGKTLAALIAAHYLVNIPWLLLREREVVDVQERDGATRISYASAPDEAGPTWTEVDLASGHYAVVVDGRLVACDGSTCAPSPTAGHWLAYCRSARRLDYPAPIGWSDGCAIEACTLTGDGEGQVVGAEVRGGLLSIEVPAATPVRLRLRPA